MDQQQQNGQKRRRPHHNNHKPKSANSQNGGQQKPAEAQAGRQQNKGRGGDIQTRRGGFHPAADVPVEEMKKSTKELREGKPQGERRDSGNRDSHHGGRDHNRNGGKGNNRNGGKGRGGDNRQSRDNGQPKEIRSNENRQYESHNSENRGGDRRRGDRNRKNENRQSPVGTPIHEIAPRDAEMDSWFAPSESKADLFAPRVETATEPELPHIELDLNDILPPIVMEKYADSTQAEEANAPTQTAEEITEEPVAQVEVLGIRFNKTGKVYYFDPKGNMASRGSYVIVETTRGLEFGEVAQPNHTVPETEIVPPLRPVVRMADEKDIAHNADNRKKEDEAFRVCLDKIRDHGLDMKLVDAQYTFDNSKLLFYFTSAGRVDFRELVKDLASVFRTRIELRQIGIRDEAKLMGGLGICGRTLCCASFLSDFTQVSIKMAKEQNLSLNSAKISGTCGRLMCCLNYEYPVYCEAARHTPSVGSTVTTPDGVGTVIEAQPLAGNVKVSLSGNASDTAPKYYRVADVRTVNEGRRTTDTDELNEVQ